MSSNSSSPPKNSPKWCSTIWRSGSGHPNWRQWELCYTNQEMDEIIRKESAKQIGTQAGVLAKGHDEDHFGALFDLALSTGEENRAILRIKFENVSPVYLFFIILPLDQNHMATFYIDVSKYFLGEGSREWNKQASTRFEDYDLGEESLSQLKRQQDRIVAMLANW